MGYIYTSDEPKKVIEVEKKFDIWAGPIRAASKSPAEVVIDLAGTATSTKTIVLVGFDEVPSWARFGREKKIIRLDWPDMGTPPFPREFWQELAEWIRQRGGSYFVGCTGGKGRTGTALAILGHFLMGWDKPITEVRKVYSASAVETQGQIEYVKRITGVEEEVQESYNYGTYGNYGGSYGTTYGPRGESTAKIVDRVVAKTGVSKLVKEGIIYIYEDEKYDSTTIVGVVESITLTKLTNGNYTVEKNDFRYETRNPDIALENFLNREKSFVELLKAAGEDPTEFNGDGYSVLGVEVEYNGDIVFQDEKLSLKKAKKLVKKLMKEVE